MFLETWIAKNGDTVYSNCDECGNSINILECQLMKGSIKCLKCAGFKISSLTNSKLDKSLYEICDYKECFGSQEVYHARFYEDTVVQVGSHLFDLGEKDFAVFLGQLDSDGNIAEIDKRLYLSGYVEYENAQYVIVHYD